MSAATPGPADFRRIWEAVRDAVENALRAVEQKQRTPDEAWQEALKSGEAAAR